MGLTLNYYEIIYSVCIGMEKGTWLELGTHGGQLSQRMVDLFDKAIAVDIARRFKTGNFIFYNESTDDFFKHFDVRG